MVGQTVELIKSVKIAGRTVKENGYTAEFDELELPAATRAIVLATQPNLHLLLISEVWATVKFKNDKTQSRVRLYEIVGVKLDDIKVIPEKRGAA